MTTFTDAHATSQELVNEGGYTIGVRGICSCGWTGPLRPVHSAQPARDLLEHCNEAKETTE